VPLSFSGFSSAIGRKLLIKKGLEFSQKDFSSKTDFFD
jgi:hypothetical protein